MEGLGGGPYPQAFKKASRLGHGAGRGIRLDGVGSEERTLRRHPVAAREPVRTSLGLSDGLVVELLADEALRLHTKLPEGSGGPAGGALSVILEESVWGAWGTWGAGGEGAGGSETISQPPGRRRGAAHSATTAGRPKDRARTPSKRPRRSPSRPATSARSWRTVTRSAKPRRRTASLRKAVFRPLASRRTSATSGRRTATTRPGSPPPEPRSSRTGGVAPSGQRSARNQGEAFGVAQLDVEGAGAEKARGPGLVEDLGEEGGGGGGGGAGVSGVGAWHRRGRQLAGAMTM